MVKTKIAVLVSGGGTNLEQLLKAEQEGRLPHGSIQLVIASSAQAYALQRAENYGVAHYGLNRKDSDFEQQIQDLLDRYQIDLIILAGFMCILSRDFVQRWEERIINVGAAIGSHVGPNAVGMVYVKKH